MKDYDLQIGRNIAYSDIASRQKVCVIGSYVAQELFGSAEKAINETLKINGYAFKVVGIVETQDEDNMEDGGTDDFVWIPYSVATSLAGSANISSYTLTVSDTDNADTAKTLIQNFLYETFKDSDLYRVTAMSEMLDSLNEQIAMMSGMLGGIAGFIDAEHALDPVYAKNIGVDIDNLYISQPDNGEQALEITETMVRSGAIDIIVVDSVAALVPKAEIDGDMGDSHVGLQARLMSQALRKLTAVISKSNCTVIFINQLREKVGVMFGNPETTTGGRALKFYSSVRLDVRRIEALKQGGEVIGNRTRVKVVKNKIAPPFKEAEFDIMFGEGISMVGDILDLAASCDVVAKSGAWYAYEGNKIGQGRENAKQYLKDNPAICDEIAEKVREHYGLKADVTAAAEKEE